MEAWVIAGQYYATNLCSARTFVRIKVTARACYKGIAASWSACLKAPHIPAAFTFHDIRKPFVVCCKYLACATFIIIRGTVEARAVVWQLA